MRSEEIMIETEDIVEATADLPVIKGRPAGGGLLGAPPLTRAQMSKDLEKCPVVGGFRLLGKFASSEWTHVFLGVRETISGIRRMAVVKVTPAKAPRYNERKSMLFDEVKTMALLDHPNIVQMLEEGETPAGCYVAMEYVPGEDLNTVLQRAYGLGLVLPPQLGCFIVIETLRALEYAHTARDANNDPLQLVHRDVTPSNILIARTGHVKLCDFGVARVRDRIQQPTMPGLVKGKLSYLAPEYATGEAIDRRVDIYGAGVVLFELLTGRKAFDASDGPAALRAIIKDGVPRQRMTETNVAPALQAIVTTATARDPSTRYKTAAELGDALETYLTRAGLYVSPSSMASIAAEHELIRSPVI